MTDISRDEIDRLYQTLDAGFSGIHARLDRMNGRVGELETDVAVMQATHPKGAAAAWGGGIAGAIVGLVEAAKWMVGK